MSAALHDIKQWAPQAVRRTDPLVARAARLWPDSPRNQGEWLRAVQQVRATPRGWLLDNPARKAAP